jgi:4-hydroxy-tetrahydrodipicolinate synthase
MAQRSVAALRGQFTALISPFDLNGNLMLGWMADLLEFQRQHGVDGLVICGTNGEATSLSVAERKQVLEAVMAHRGALAIIAGTGAASVTDAVELTRHAAEVGADAALLLPPFFFKNPSADGLVTYFRQVLDAAPLPMLLYSIPQQTAVPITEEILDRLADHPNLVGVKDSAGDWEYTLRLIQRYPQLKIFPGSDYLIGKGYTHGAAGAISGGANPFPELVVAVRNGHYSDPTGAKALQAQERLTAATDIVRRYPFVGVSKCILAHRGLPRMGVRPPLISLTALQEEQLLDELYAADFLPRMVE